MTTKEERAKKWSEYVTRKKDESIKQIIDLARKITAEGGGNIKFAPDKPPYMKNASEMQEDLRK